jgi:hypothetical protein
VTSTIPTSVNIVIAGPDMAFLGDLSDYDTDVLSFSLSINIALALLLSSYIDSAADASQPTNMSPHDLCAYRAYIAMNGPSHASIAWNANCIAVGTLDTMALPIAYTASQC